MLDYLIPKNEVDNESDYHNTIRTQTENPIQKEDERVLAGRNQDGNRSDK